METRSVFPLFIFQQIPACYSEPLASLGISMINLNKSRSPHPQFRHASFAILCFLPRFAPTAKHDRDATDSFFFVLSVALNSLPACTIVPLDMGSFISGRERLAIVVPRFVPHCLDDESTRSKRVTPLPPHRQPRSGHTRTRARLRQHQFETSVLDCYLLRYLTMEGGRGRHGRAEM